MSPSAASDARPLTAWYVACTSRELLAAPRATTVSDVPMVLFRDETGKPRALLDRCPHRNVPLSIGRCVTQGGERQLQCAYHGWQFDGEGACTHVPALPIATSGEANSRADKGRRVDAFETREQDGFVWVCPVASALPKDEPLGVPKRAGYAEIRYQASFPASLLNVAENILDVPHTAFLHRGLFRGGKPNKIVAVVKRDERQIEAEYVGEPRPSGLLGSLLAPQGGVLRHFDRFIAPGIAQVEYALGDKSHLIVSNLLTPETALKTRVYTHVALRLPFGLAKPVSWVLLPVALWVLRQDTVILKELSQNSARFGGEQFVSTDVDILGPGIVRLMRSLERGDVLSAKEERIEILA